MTAANRDDRLPGRVLWVLWLTYGSFYFCRTNISAAVPGIEEELQLSKEQIGLILGSLKLAYGIGQFINGQLAERFPPRALLALGMFGSAALNVLFGFSTGLYFLVFVWACNGYVQAFGWTPTMRVAANWLPPWTRGRAVGIIGTGYQLTAALTFVVAGYSAQLLGWRWALWVPAGLLVLSALHMLLLLEERPQDTGRVASDAPPPMDDGPRPSFTTTVLATLSNPALWLLAVALGLLNASRYGFLDWGITHLHEVQGEGVGKSAIKYMVLPLGGIAGAFVSGWATDRFFDGRRAPVICTLLVALTGLTLVYHSAVEAGTAATVVVLVLVGFCIYGPQVLLVGTTPIDLARRGGPAAAVGFVNCMGYLGAFTGDIVTGSLVENHGWEVGIWFWAGCALAAALSVAALWNARARS